MAADLFCVLVGPVGAGKSSTVLRWVSNFCPPEYDPGIEDNYRKMVIFKDRQMMLDILEFAGREVISMLGRFERMKAYRPQLHCAIFVYDISSAQSFRECFDLFKEFRAVPGQEKTDVLFLANKLDLAEKREVTLTEAKDILEKEGVVNIMECSCKDNTNMELALQKLASILYPQLPAESPKKTSRGGCNVV